MQVLSFAITLRHCLKTGTSVFTTTGSEDTPKRRFPRVAGFNDVYTLDPFVLLHRVLPLQRSAHIPPCGGNKICTFSKGRPAHFQRATLHFCNGGMYCAPFQWESSENMSCKAADVLARRSSGRPLTWGFWVYGCHGQARVLLHRELSLQRSAHIRPCGN